MAATAAVPPISVPLAAAGGPAAGPATGVGSPTAPEPHWKRKHLATKSLYAACLAVVGKQCGEALAHWPTDAAAEEALLISNSPHKRPRTSAQLKADILSSVRKAGTFQDDAFPSHFFRNDFPVLSLSGCAKASNAYILKICSQCPDTEELDLTECFYVLDEGLATILSTCPKLRRISLGGCRKLSSKAVDILIANSPHLEGIKLGGCFNLRATDMLRLLKSHPNARNFRMIDISGTLFTDETLRLIADTCPELTHIGLGYANKVSDDAFEYLCKACTKIESLHLHCDRAMEILMRQLPVLSDLDIMGAAHFSPAAIHMVMESRSVVRHNPDMEVVESEADRARRTLAKMQCRFSSLSNGTTEDIEGLKAEFPDLKLTI